MSESHSHDKNEFNQPVGQKIKDWHRKDMPARIPLIGEFCILEPLDIKKHSIQLFEVLAMDNQGESWTYLPYGPFATCEEFQGWLQTILAELDTLLYAVLDAKSLQPIGITGFLRINPDHGVIEVGHLHYSKLLKKTAAATEAMYLMMKYAFEELGYRRYEWKCHSLNQASWRAALRLGFTFEGIFRQCNVVKNRNRDTAWFSILDSEWPEIKARFQNWLSPDNFDAGGNQLRRLNHSIK